MNRLAAGMLGPTSTFSTRRGQKVASASAILSACRKVLDEGDVCPSIENVLAAGVGFARTTLHRPRYKAVLRAAKTRFAARATGAWKEGDEDEFAKMERDVELGTWTPCLRAADFTTSLRAGATTNDEDVDPSFAPDAPGASPVAEAVDADALAADNEELRISNARLSGELQRRDDQLYHALQTAQRWSRTIRHLREMVRRLSGEIETLQTAPWDPREQVFQNDDGFEDGDWPET